MIYMLCRNRVADYASWRAVFDSHLEAQRDSGLQLVNLWRDLEEPNNVFFLFEVTDEEKARAFVTDPSAERVGKEAGVLDGEIHFVDGDPIP